MVDWWVLAPLPAEGGGESVFDVYSRGGALERTVVLPLALQSDPPPFVSDQRVVGVIRDPATHVETVVAFRIPAGGLGR